MFNTRLAASAILLGFTVATATGDPPKPLKLPAGVTHESLTDAEEAERVAKLLEAEYPEPRSEAAKMLIAILRGSKLEGRDGWFGPGESRFNWAWLAKRHGVDAKTGTVARDKFKGRLNSSMHSIATGTGKLAASDLDWSDRNPYVMQASMLTRLFRRMDASGDGKLTREDSIASSSVWRQMGTASRPTTFAAR